MHEFLSLIKRFQSDERGVFLVFFGVIGLVLIATAGAVVDFTTIEQARARAQDALDSAALGLQPSIFEGATEESIEPLAQDLLDERLADASVTADVTNVTINDVDGMLRLEATITVPMAFVALVGIETVDANVVSEATRKRLNIEVAMVLDNSGSMADASRMDNLKIAAKCAINVLLNSDCDSVAETAGTTQVKIGVVPFTEFVNVGTGYKNATWMDGTGVSPIANDNFDTDDNDATANSGAVNRFTLYDQLTNVDWRGCVEARQYPYDTNDTAPDPAVPATLFVPEFAPDNPDGWSYSNNYIDDTPAACNVATNRGLCEISEVTTNCVQFSGSYYCFGGTTTTVKLTAAGTGIVSTGSGVCSCSGETIISDNTSYSSGTWKTRTRTYSCNDFSTATSSGLSDRELQERVCKYTGAIDTGWGKGPNWDCPTNSLLPLTNTKSDIVDAIDAMYPQGFTNIHQGAIWGYHMLTHTEPLTEAEDFDSAVYKVMIIMTDGANTVDGYNSGSINKASGYMAYGYPGPPVASPGQAYNGRIYSTAFPTPASNGDVTGAMDDRTEETCANAKAAGITIYTIGLSVPNSTTEDMLENCANGPDYDFFPSSPGELTDVFKTIAGQLGNLRLAK